MLRIGILTYHRSINYGAVMQAYALACRLGELEQVQVEIIDYMSRRMDIYYKLFTVYRGKNGVLRLADRFKMYRAFSRNMKELPLSGKRLVSDSLSRFYKYVSGSYDVIVVGSDAVWNYEKRGFPNPYFLTEDTQARRVSYAASCNGINYDGLDQNRLDELKAVFERFEYLGVRDKLTELVVNRALGQERAEHNCDPTFLLDFERDGLGDVFCASLKKKLVRMYGLDPDKRYIGLMLSNLNGNLAETLVKNLRKRYGKTHQIVSVYSYCGYADIPYIADLTPFEWSRIFSMFDITFSKYFHGTLLSLKNGTPVISLGAEKSMKHVPAKVEDVLKRMELMEFYAPARGAEHVEWKTLMERVDMYMQEPPRDRIAAAVCQEAKSADGFFEYIRTLQH